MINQFDELITRKELKNRFFIKNSLLNRYFFNADTTAFLKQHKLPQNALPVSLVEDIMQNKDFQNEYYSKRYAEIDGKLRIDARKKLLAASDINYLFSTVPNAERKFILHIGPTNSGKTFHALERLKQAKSGIYLAPLRLLALEIFDTLNLSNVNCSLLTGEEREEVPFSKVTSSTIEMCNFYDSFDVAVIDECQMIADEERGQHWTKAILQLNADEIHLCLAPEGADIIISLLKSINAKYTVNYYERLVPLKFSGKFNNLAEVKPGDALIAFSRQKVLSIAAKLEDLGIKTSVIYGWLPPVARREEIRRFKSGESSVIVATDAIGMGVSLPIRRIIFCETKKHYAGTAIDLHHAEIKQIAGRAGRYGKFDIGEVLTMSNSEIIKKALDEPVKALKHITLPFPREVITEDINLQKYIEEWNGLLLSPSFRRERLDNAYNLLLYLKNIAKSFSNNELFRLITCPFNTCDKHLTNYWYKCCLAIKNKEALERPDFSEDNLTECEIQYRAYEILYHLSKSSGIKDNFASYRLQLCLKINKLLLGGKAMFIPICKNCGKRLSIPHTGSLCPSCMFNESIKIVVTSEGYFFKNKIADITTFKKSKKII